jgi:hypothetical protein
LVHFEKTSPNLQSVKRGHISTLASKIDPLAQLPQNISKKRFRIPICWEILIYLPLNLHASITYHYSCKPSISYHHAYELLIFMPLWTNLPISSSPLLYLLHCRLDLLHAIGLFDRVSICWKSSLSENCWKPACVYFLGLVHFEKHLS